MLAGISFWEAATLATRNILVGMRMPEAMVAELIDGQLVPRRACDVVGRRRTLVVGVPGAFTPVCTERHVPGLVANAAQLRRSGFDNIVCVVASDPFVMDAWSKSVDPERSIRFVSDGNLNLCRALGLVTHEQELFLGDRSERYMLVVQNGVIEALRVETKITDYSCTRPDAFVVEGV